MSEGDGALRYVFEKGGTQSCKVGNESIDCYSWWFPSQWGVNLLLD